MKKIETLLLFVTVTAVAQAPKPVRPPATPPGPAFTQVEQVLVKEIQTRHDELQELVNEFMEEVRRAHPGYEFRGGSIVPIPPAPKAEKPKEEKKP